MTYILGDIGIIARALDSIANIEFKEIHLTRGQYLYLVRIREHPGIILEALSELLKVDRATASRAVGKLAEQKLIEKVSDEQNLKIKHLYMTDLGREYSDYILAEHTYSNCKALRGLSEAEIKQFAETLTKIRLNVEKEWEWVKSGHSRDY